MSHALYSISVLSFRFRIHVETNIYKQTAEEAVILKAETIWQKKKGEKNNNLRLVPPFTNADISTF